MMRSLFSVLSLFIFSFCVAQKAKDSIAGKVKALNLVAEHKGPLIGDDHPDVIASNNKSGFETGQVVKLNGVYHMFVNEMFDRPHMPRAEDWSPRRRQPLAIHPA